MKKKYILKLLTVFSSWVIFSCANQNRDLAQSEIIKIEKEVLSSFEKFENSLVDGELETISKYYSNDSRFYWVENGAIAYPTGASARKSIENFYPSLKEMKFNSLAKKVTPISNSSAMLFVEYEQILILPSDQQIEINGAMTIFMEKKDSDWEFIIGHSSGKRENQG